MAPGWAKIPAAAKYAGISPRTLRDWLKQGLRHVRLPSGTVLIKLAWLDGYLEQFENSKDQCEEIINEIFNDF